MSTRGQQETEMGESSWDHWLMSFLLTLFVPISSLPRCSLLEPGKYIVSVPRGSITEPSSRLTKPPHSLPPSMQFQIATINASGVSISEPKSVPTSWGFAEGLRGYGPQTQ